MKSILLCLLPLAWGQCSFEGRDLSPHVDFGTMGPIVDTSSIFSTYLSVCHDGTQTCQLTPEMALRYQTVTFCSSVVGRWNENEVDYELIESGGSVTGVRQKFSNGDLCFGQSATEESKTTIEFMCDPDATGDQYTTTSENFQCDWVFTVQSPYACAGSAGGGAGGGVSGGWIFVIILLVCSFLYLIVGFLYKTRSKGTSGAESIPNIEFWRQLPGLVKDGCSYTWGLICGQKYQAMGDSGGGGGQTGGEYQQQSGF